MCCGVTMGLAFEKFSGSLKMFGVNDMMVNSSVIMIVIINMSL